LFEGLKEKLFEKDIRERVNAELEAREEAEHQVLGDANIILNCLRNNHKIGFGISYDRLRSTFIAMGGTADEDRFLNGLKYLKKKQFLSFDGRRGTHIGFIPANIPKRV
jgi:hypothetical protein